MLVTKETELRKKPITASELFKTVYKLLQEQGYIPDSFIDYALPSLEASDYEVREPYNGSLEIEFKVVRGGSEGIYTDIFLVVYDKNDKKEIINIGTIKTLDDDREAMRKMACIGADFMVSGNEYLWEQNPNTIFENAHYISFIRKGEMQGCSGRYAWDCTDEEVIAKYESHFEKDDKFWYIIFNLKTRERIKIIS